MPLSLISGAASSCCLDFTKVENVWMLRLCFLTSLFNEKSQTQCGYFSWGACSFSPIFFPLKARGKILCKKGGRQGEYLTIICLWQVMFYLKHQCFEAAEPGGPCNLRADWAQQLAVNPWAPTSFYLSLPLLHLPLQSLSPLHSHAPWCACEALDKNAVLVLDSTVLWFKHGFAVTSLLSALSPAGILLVTCYCFYYHSFPPLSSQSYFQLPFLCFLKLLPSALFHK